jgi:hypothetical protein
MTVEANVSASQGDSNLTVKRKDRESGLGDIILMPRMFNDKVNEDLNTNLRLAVGTPAG